MRVQRMNRFMLLGLPVIFRTLTIKVVGRLALEDHSAAQDFAVGFHHGRNDDAFPAFELAFDASRAYNSRRAAGQLFDHPLAEWPLVKQRDQLHVIVVAHGLHNVPVQIVAIICNVEHAVADVAGRYAIIHVLHAGAVNLPKHDDVASAVAKRVEHVQHAFDFQRLPIYRGHALEFLLAVLLMGAAHESKLVALVDHAYPTVGAVNLLGYANDGSGWNSVRVAIVILDVGVLVEHRVLRGHATPHSTAAAARHDRWLVLDTPVELGHVGLGRTTPSRQMRQLGRQLGDKTEAGHSAQAAGRHPARNFQAAVERMFEVLLYAQVFAYFARNGHIGREVDHAVAGLVLTLGNDALGAENLGYLQAVSLGVGFDGLDAFDADYDVAHGAS